MEKKIVSNATSTRWMTKKFGKLSIAKGWLIMSGYLFHRLIEHDGKRRYGLVSEWMNRQGDIAIVLNDENGTVVKLKRAPKKVVEKLSKTQRKKLRLFGTGTFKF